MEVVKIGTYGELRLKNMSFNNSYLYKQNICYYTLILTDLKKIKSKQFNFETYPLSLSTYFHLHCCTLIQCI